MHVLIFSQCFISKIIEINVSEPFVCMCCVILMFVFLEPVNYACKCMFLGVLNPVLQPQHLHLSFNIYGIHLQVHRILMRTQYGEKRNQIGMYINLTKALNLQCTVEDVSSEWPYNYKQHSSLLFSVQI